MNFLSQEPRRPAKTQLPTVDETECYAHIILQHEGRPASSLPDCRREAELQLWADRNIIGSPRARRAPRRARSAG